MCLARPHSSVTVCPTYFAACSPSECQISVWSKSASTRWVRSEPACCTAIRAKLLLSISTISWKQWRRLQQLDLYSTSAAAHLCLLCCSEDWGVEVALDRFSFWSTSLTRAHCLLMRSSIVSISNGKRRQQTNKAHHTGRTRKRAYSDFQVLEAAQTGSGLHRLFRVQIPADSMPMACRTKR